MSISSLTAHRPPLAIAAAFLLLAGLVALTLAAFAPAKAAVELGKTARTPNPLCPKNCLATGTVTGFQVSANGEKGLFKVPEDGHIVAWSVDLSKPEDTQIASFNDKFMDKRYEGRSVARLAMLKPEGRSRYKLSKQTPPIELEPKFGKRPIFTLNKPVRVKKGIRIGLTLPTWAPLYKNRLKQDDVWAASRNPDECGDANILEAKPQQKLGSVRPYGCKFTTERLLYWAYFVPSN